MTTENKAMHSPLPWRAVESMARLKNIIIDADGHEVCAAVLEYPNGVECDEANAALIVAAVNGQKEKNEHIAYLKRIIGELLPIARTEFCRLTEISFSLLRTHPNDKELIGEIGDVLKDMIRLFDEADAVFKNEGAK